MGIEECFFPFIQSGARPVAVCLALVSWLGLLARWMSTFSKNRDLLLDADVAAKFLAAVLKHPRVRRVLSEAHFSVDGTLIEARASMKSVRPKDGSDDPPGPGRNGDKDFRGQRRRNETHASTTDPDAKLFRKGNGREARLCFMGHALMENRSSLIVQARLSQGRAPPSGRRPLP